MKLFAKKSLGQHFLTSPTALSTIIEAAHLQKGETVLEIGPGTGILTRALLAADARVIAIEKDVRSVALLEQELSKEISAGSFKLNSADILETDLGLHGLINGQYAIVANIPYYITGAILEKCLEYTPRPNRMVLLVQKEVADRIVATDGKESILSISVKAFGKPRVVAKVPRGAFSPPPNVDSAILSIDDISDRRFVQKGLETRRFFDIVTAGFAHKRKLLKRNLEEAIPAEKLDEIWQKINLDPNLRAEDVSLDTWFDICV